MTDKPQFVGEKRRLSDLCSKGKSSLRQKDILNNGSYPVYGASGIVGTMNYYQNETPYVGIVKDGAGVGRVMMCEAYSSVLGTMQALIPKENINNNYLLHLVRYLRLGDSFSGSTIPHIYFKNYGERLVPSFSSAQQTEIASIFNQIEALMERQKAALDKLDQLIKSRFVEVFGDGSQYQTCRMNRLIVSIKAGTNIGGNQRILEQDEYAVLKISAVTSGTFCPDEYKVVDDVSSIKMIHPCKGDLLFSRANTSEMVGATAIVDQDYEQLFLPDKLWRLDPADDVNRVFLKHLLSSAKLRAEMSKVATGSSGSMQNISMEKFRALKAFIPPPCFATMSSRLSSARSTNCRFVDLVK